MLTRPFRLFSLFGIEIRLDPGWLVLAAVVTWSLAAQLFPILLPHRPAAHYWALGVLGTLGLVVSLLLHELGHALVARRDGVRIEAITLFLFGGVAELQDEPPGPGAELRMAAAGPLASLLLGGACGAAGSLLPLGGPATALLLYLAFVNLMLAAFNLVPAFPLDGGRVLRAALWAMGRDPLRATRIAARSGEGFALCLGGAGLYAVATGNPVGGLWWCLLALFLRGAAQGSYRQAQVRAVLRGEPVRRLMRPAEAGGLADWPSEAPPHRTRTTPAAPLPPDADALEALLLMSRAGAAWLVVMEEGRPVGVLLLPDLMRFAAARLAERLD